MHWYVKVDNQAYGPYSDDQMRGFVNEGRVTTNSLISNAPDAGFFGAAEYDAFNLWLSMGQQTIEQPLVAIGGGSVVANTTPLYAPVQQVNQQAGYAAQVQEQVQDQPQPQPNYQQPKRATDNISVQPTANMQSTQSSVFLIMAEIRSEGEMAFLQSMQSFGQTQRVGDTVWLVRSASSVERIRNALSQTLNQQDRLFILDTSVGKTAWFNIGADLDHRIRELWDEDEA